MVPVLIILSLIFGATAAAAANCPLHRAVYVAEVVDQDGPDELRFSFKARPGGHFYMDKDYVQQVVVTSKKMDTTLHLGTSFTNGTGLETVSATIPKEEFSGVMQEAAKLFMEPFETLDLESTVRAVYPDFSTAQLPAKDGETLPMLVILPDLRSWSHTSNNGIVSPGLSWGVFKFDRCDEAK